MCKIYHAGMTAQCCPVLHQCSLAAALVADLHADWSSGGLQAPQKAKGQEDFQVNLLRLAKLQ